MLACAFRPRFVGDARRSGYRTCSIARSSAGTIGRVRLPRRGNPKGVRRPAQPADPVPPARAPELAGPGAGSGGKPDKAEAVLCCPARTFLKAVLRKGYKSARRKSRHAFQHVVERQFVEVCKRHTVGSQRSEPAHPDRGPPVAKARCARCQQFPKFATSADSIVSGKREFPAGSRNS